MLSIGTQLHMHEPTGGCSVDGLWIDLSLRQKIAEYFNSSRGP